ncbi:hypothetical protein CEXT_700951 [Caerostris extrusa]|uniref:Uncharacterized protein n=1 Tax=Caerostris extrusa TaxID=172846 RepID=A0AAV4X7V6_CAEEX|nr:hypothetical protein CEXT_700951 [Caerostris extrusa]
MVARIDWKGLAPWGFCPFEEFARLMRLPDEGTRKELDNAYFQSSFSTMAVVMTLCHQFLSEGPFREGPSPKEHFFSRISRTTGCQLMVLTRSTVSHSATSNMQRLVAVRVCPTAYVVDTLLTASNQLIKSITSQTT